MSGPRLGRTIVGRHPLRVRGRELIRRARHASVPARVPEALAPDEPEEYEQRASKRPLMSAVAAVDLRWTGAPACRLSRACARCERRRPLPSRSSSPHALAWERASRPKPAKVAVNLVLRARVEQDLAPMYSPQQIARPGQCSGMFPEAATVGRERTFCCLLPRARLVCRAVCRLGLGDPERRRALRDGST